MMNFTTTTLLPSNFTGNIYRPPVMYKTIYLSTLMKYPYISFILNLDHVRNFAFNTKNEERP
jgi:hypothetical protein